MKLIRDEQRFHGKNSHSKATLKTLARTFGRWKIIHFVVGSFHPKGVSDSAKQANRLKLLGVHI